MSPDFQNVGVVHKPCRFRLRLLFALTTVLACVAFIAQWLISVGMHPAAVGMLAIPLTASALAGIAFTVRRNKSTLMGAIIGGVTATMVCPGSYILFLCAKSMNAVSDLSGLWFALGISVVVSALIAAVIGVLREGLAASNDI